MSENRVYVKIHKQGSRRFIACCDYDILGKEFNDGKVSIDVKESFYGGDLIEIEELPGMI